MHDILTKRPISHEEARECLRRFCGSHFRDGREHARIGIPARPDYDDDLVLSAYIRQQEQKDQATQENPREISATLLQAVIARNSQ
jgi:hypothetical protein